MAGDELDLIGAHLTATFNSTPKVWTFQRDLTSEPDIPDVSATWANTDISAHASRYLIHSLQQPWPELWEL